MDTRTLADGTVITTEVHDHDRDHLTDAARDDSADDHLEIPAIGGSEGTEQDHSHFDDTLRATDEAHFSDSGAVAIVIPVVGGTLKRESDGALVDDDTFTETDDDHGPEFEGRDLPPHSGESDPVESTDLNSGVLHTHDSLSLIATDPITRFMTKIYNINPHVTRPSRCFGDK